jgi:phage/plasmid-associated DNA primase
MNTTNDNKMIDTNIDMESHTSLCSLMDKYGVKPKWIHYTLDEKGNKTNICGRKKNWTKSECYNNSVWLSKENDESRYVVMEFDISNTALAIFDDDKKGRTYEETIAEYPFLQRCYYAPGNTKGFHFIVRNEEFKNARKVIDTDNERDLITDFIWFKSNKLYGEGVFQMDLDIIKEQFPTFNTSTEEVKKILIKKTNEDCLEDIEKKMENKFLEALLDNIGVQYCDNFKSWFNIVGALKAMNEIGYIDYFSSKSSKYQVGNYNSIVRGITGQNFTIGTIYHYSRLSSPAKHFQILEDFDQVPINAYDELGDDDYAQLFISISDELFYHSTRECYYVYDNTSCYWKVGTIDTAYPIVRGKVFDWLDKELKKNYHKSAELEMCKTMKKNCNCKLCAKKETYEKQRKQIEKNIHRCKSYTNHIHILKAIFCLLLEKKYTRDIEMDCNPYLFCWDNKTYDIENKKFIKRDKYDYITNTTGYDYEVGSDEVETDYYNEINYLMMNIFSNEEVAKCFFSVCKSGLTGVLEEKFTLANGSGGNGKGLVNFVMRLLLGNYFHDVSHSVITKEITGDKPLPEISQLNGKRYCVISEIKEDSILLEDSIKKLTNSIINARGMYSSQTRVINRATYVAECNARPKISGENGDAMCRRYIDVFFNKRYTTDPEKLLLDGYLPANPIYKTDDYWLPRRIAFFHWLMRFDDTIYEPPVVKQRSKEFLSECNIPLTVFNDNVQKCEFDKTTNTVITASDFLEIVRNSEEYKNLEKKEKKLYTKNKIIDFFKNTFFDDYKVKQNIGNSCNRNCIIGYRIINNNDYIEED